MGVLIPENHPAQNTAYVTDRATARAALLPTPLPSIFCLVRTSSCGPATDGVME